MPTVPCPLSGCSSEHELKRAKNKHATPYVTCQSWGGSTVFLRGDLGSQWLGRNGGAIPGQENPGQPLRIVETFGADDEADETDREDLPAQPNPVLFERQLSPETAALLEQGERLLAAGREIEEIAAQREALRMMKRERQRQEEESE